MFKIKRLIINAYIIFVSIICFSISASAISNSKLATGTRKLIEDITTWLTVLAIPVTVGIIIYCFIRKGAADEQDQKMWQKRIVTSLVCGIGAILAASLVNVLTGYFM